MKTASTRSGARTAWHRAIAAAVLMLCFTSVTGRAEDNKDYALIYGTVFRADGRTISGVPIKIQRVGDKKPKWEMVSDQRGEFAQRVPVGDHEYRVTAEIKHSKNGKKPETTVHILKNERADISLHLPE